MADYELRLKLIQSFRHDEQNVPFGVYGGCLPGKHLPIPGFFHSELFPAQAETIPVALTPLPDFRNAAYQRRVTEHPHFNVGGFEVAEELDIRSRAGTGTACKINIPTNDGPIGFDEGEFPRQNLV